MFSKINSFLKSEFAVALSTTSITTGFQMVVGLVINKIISLTIGPSGIALMGQFTNFKDISTNLSNGSFGQGITKYLADPEIDNKKILATSNLFTLAVSTLLGIIISILSEFLSLLLFNTNQYSYIFIIFGFSLPFFAFNNLLISTVNGYRDYKLLAKIKLTNSLVALLISTTLVIQFLMDGALIAQSINTSIIFIFSLAFIYKIRTRYFSFQISLFDFNVLKKLLGFTLMAITATLLKPFIQIFLRDYIIQNSSVFEAGIWEGTKRISDYYTQIITIALSAYYLPKLSSLKVDNDIRKEIWNGIKVILPLITLLAIIIYTFKSFIIQLLFSIEFISIKDLILPQLIGDFLMITSFMIAYLMLAKALIKLFIISQLIFALSRIFFSLLFFNYSGIEGMIWANALNYFLYLIFSLITFRKILFKKHN